MKICSICNKISATGRKSSWLYPKKKYWVRKCRI